MRSARFSKSARAKPRPETDSLGLSFSVRSPAAGVLVSRFFLPHAACPLLCSIGIRRSAERAIRLLQQFEKFRVLRSRGRTGLEQLAGVREFPLSQQSLGQPNLRLLICGL